MKNRAGVLVCDPTEPIGIQRLEETGFEVDVKPTISSDELEKVNSFSGS